MTFNSKQNDSNLLLENLICESKLDMIFAPVAAAMKDFGSIVASTAKLIMTDVNYLITLTFSRLRTLEELKSLREGFRQKRAKHLKNVTDKSNKLLENWPDGKIGCMMVAPGLFFTNRIIAGGAYLGDVNVKQHLNDMGFDKIPPFNMFTKMSAGDSARFFASLDPNDPERSRMEFQTQLGIQANTGDKPGTGLLSKINSMFLFSGDIKSGQNLSEGEEEIKEPTEKQMKLFLELMAEAIEENWPLDRTIFLEDRKEYFEPLVEEATKVMDVNTRLAAATEPEEFFQLLEELKKVAGEKGASLDIDEIKQGFATMGEKIKKDPESMEKIKEKLGKSDDALKEGDDQQADPEVNKQIGLVCLDTIKGQFLVKLRENLTEYYDEVYDEITNEIDPKTLKFMKKTPHGNSFVKQIDTMQKKLDSALSNLK